MLFFSPRPNYSHLYSSDQAFFCRFCNPAQLWHISDWFGCGFGLTSFWPRGFQRVTGSSRQSRASVALRLSALTDQCRVLLVFHGWPLACFVKLVLLSLWLLCCALDSQAVPSNGWSCTILAKWVSYSFCRSCPSTGTFETHWAKSCLTTLVAFPHPWPHQGINNWKSTFSICHLTVSKNAKSLPEHQRGTALGSCFCQAVGARAVGALCPGDHIRWLVPPVLHQKGAEGEGLTFPALRVKMSHSYFSAFE